MNNKLNKKIKILLFIKVNYVKLLININKKIQK